MLTTHMNGQELGWILGKQLLSSLQTLFRLIGPELNLITSLRGCRIKATTNGGVVAASNVCAIFEDTLQRCKSLPPPLNGVELARMMRVGTRVVRGVDWKWGDQDGPTPSEVCLLIYFWSSCLFIFINSLFTFFREESLVN